MANVKEAKVVEFLEMFEKAGAEGLVLCAPNKLKKQVSAFKYSPDGELGDKEGFINECLQYLAEARIQKVMLVSKKGEEEEVPVRFYRLSSIGETWLAQYREREHQEKLKEAEKKAREIAGIQSAIQDYTKWVQELTEKLKPLQEVTEKLGGNVSQEMAEAKQSLVTKTEGIQKDISQLSENLHKVLSKLAEELPKELSHLSTKLPQDVSQIVEKLPPKFGELLEGLNDKITGLAENIPQEIAKLSEGLNGRFTQTSEGIQKGIGQMSEKFDKEIAGIGEKFQKEISQMTDRFQKEIVSLSDKLQKETAVLGDRFQKETAVLGEKFQKESGQIADRYQKETSVAGEKCQKEITQVSERLQKGILQVDVESQKGIASLLADSKEGIANLSSESLQQISVLSSTSQEQISKLATDSEKGVLAISKNLEESKNELKQQIVECEGRLKINIASPLAKEIALIQTNLKDLEFENRIWTEAIQKSAFLASAPIENLPVPPRPNVVSAKPPEIVFEKTSGEPTVKEEEKGKRLLAPNTLEVIEDKIVAQMLPLIPREEAILIESLYQELQFKKIFIRPGHLNDLLWLLHQERRVELQLWTNPINNLRKTQHAIFRPDMTVYAYVKRL